MTLGFENNMYNNGSSSVYSLMTLPYLETLHLEPQDWSARESKKIPRFHFTSFMTFVRRSSFLLTMFSIQSLALSDVNLLSLRISTFLDFTVTDTDHDTSTEFSPITSHFIASLHVASLRGCLTREHCHISMDPEQTLNEPCLDTSALQANCLRALTVKFLYRKEIPGAHKPLKRIGGSGIRAIVLWKK